MLRKISNTIFIGIVMLSLLFLGQKIIQAQQDIVITGRILGNTVVFIGDTIPNGFIVVLLEGVPVASNSATTDGSFTITVPNVSIGNHNFGIYVEDSESRVSPTVGYSFDVTYGATIIVNDVLLPPTIGLNPSTLNENEEFTISGYTTPNSDVTIMVEGLSNPLTTTSNNNNGYWELTRKANWGDGTFDIYVYSTTGTGQQTDNSSTVSLLVNDSIETDIPCDGYFIGDLNCDGYVNLQDFSILMFYWGNPGGFGDINLDDIVGLKDLSIMLFNWTG